MKVDLFVDAKGLSCPMPIVQAKKGIDQLESGQVLKIETTDPGSVSDLQSWAKQVKHELLEHTEADGIYTFYIKKV